MTTTSTLIAPDPDTTRADLVDAIGRNNRHRQRRNRMIAGPIAMALIAVVGVGVLLGTSTEPAHALRSLPNGTIEVEVNPDFDDVDALASDLRAAGVEAVVVALRGHPSLDGLVEVASHSNEASGAVTRSFDGRMFVIDPSEVNGEVEILIYSTAADGETYQFAPSLFAAGQPLEGLPCEYRDTPLTSAEFARRADAANVGPLTWVLFEDFGPDATGTELNERPDGVVASAAAASAELTRVVVVSPTGDELPAAQTLSMSDGSHDAGPGCGTP